MRMVWLGTCVVVGALDGVAFADEPADPSTTLAPSVSGHLDGTYNYNFTRPLFGISQLHSYTAKHNTFLLNTAHLAIGGHDDRVSYVVELDAGTDGARNSAAYGGDLIDVQEAWVAYVHPEAKVGFKAGKFVTFGGIEVIENTANPTISRGLLFGLAEPATHVGALVTYAINETLDVAAGAVSGWDVLVDNNSLKTLVAKIGITTDALRATVSALAGPEQPGNNDDWRATLDATAVIVLSSVDLWLQANVGMEQGLALDDAATVWFGVGVQPVVHLDDRLSVGARIEGFADQDGARTGVPGGALVGNLSVAPAYQVTDQLTLRAEARLDASTENIYRTADGEALNAEVIALTEVLYTFGT